MQHKNMVEMYDRREHKWTYSTNTVVCLKLKEEHYVSNQI